MELRAHKVLFEEDGEVEDGEAVLVGVRLRKRCGESRLKTAVHIFYKAIHPRLKELWPSVSI